MMKEDRNPSTDGKDSLQSDEKKHFFQPTENGWTIAIYAFLVALFYILCVMVGLNVDKIPNLLTFLFSVISPLVYGFCIAFVLSPLVKFFENRVLFMWKRKGLGFKHVLCIIFAYLVALAIVVVCVIFLIPQIASTYRQFSSQLSISIVNLRNALASLISRLPGAEQADAFVYFNINPDFRLNVQDFVIVDTLNNPWGFGIKVNNSSTQLEIQEMIDGIGKTIVDAINKALPSLFSSAWDVLLELKNLLLGLIISVYFLVCRRSLTNTIQKLARAWLPKKVYRRAGWLIEKGKNIFRDYIVVRILDSVIVGLITFIGLLIVQNPYALLISLVIAISALIPFIGPVIGISICSVLMLLLGFGYAFFFALVMVGVQLLDDRIIEPLLNKGHSQHRLAGIWVFSAIVLMSGLFGFIGLVFGIPIFAFLYSVIKEWSELRLRRSGQPIATADYGQLPPKRRKKKKLMLYADENIEATEETDNSSDEEPQ